MELQDFIIRVTLALGSGFLIGLEREFKSKSAGLKTNMLVALGASIFVLVSLEFSNKDYTDLTRVLGQVVTGIVFLGAGAIIQKGTNIKGLTTAATIWCSAGAGCLAAVGLYWELLTITVLVLIVNFIFGLLDTKIENTLKD